MTSKLYGYLWARTAYFDAIFREQCAEDIPQIVLLGAGYDTRAIRFRENIRHTRIFELDLPTTQARKQQQIDAAGVARPDGLVYVPFNFETDDLAGLSSGRVTTRRGGPSFSGKAFCIT